jgi:hypothetical protein
MVRIDHILTGPVAPLGREGFAGDGQGAGRRSTTAPPRARHRNGRLDRPRREARLALVRAARGGQGADARDALGPARVPPSRAARD